MTQLATRPPNGNPIDMRKPVGDTRRLQQLLETSEQRLLDVLPRGLTPARLMRTVLLAVNKTPKLLNCSSSSILESVINAAVVGLEIGGALGYSFLIPYGDTCQLIIGYKGYVRLAYNSGEVISFSGACVYADEEFDYRLGDEPRLVHVPNIRDERKDSEIVGAYMVCKMRDGAVHRDFRSMQQILKAKASSKSAGNSDSPWKNWFPEMCVKTAIRHGIKMVPMSSERFSRALEIEDQDFDPSGRVLEARTGDRQGDLLRKITNRPVSEGMTYTPDADAIEAAHKEAAEHVSDAQTGELLNGRSGVVGPAANAPAAEQEPADGMSDADKREVMLGEAYGHQDQAVNRSNLHALAMQQSGGKLTRKDFEGALFRYAVGQKYAKVDSLQPADYDALDRAIRENRWDVKTGAIQD